MRNVDYFSVTPGTRKWHMWGKVVDEYVASNASKCNLVDLGSSGGNGPRSSLGGSAHQNLKKSDACLGFMMRPLPVLAESTAKKKS